MSSYLLHLVAFIAFLGGVVSYLMEDFSFLLSFSITSAIILLLLSATKSRIGIFSLTTGGLITMTAYSFAVPIHFYFFEDYDGNAVHVALFACLLALNSQYVGYWLAQNINLVNFKKNIGIPTDQYYRIGIFYRYCRSCLFYFGGLSHGWV